MIRHTAKLSKATNEVMVHSSIIHSMREGKVTHISVEFEGQWIYSFNDADQIEGSMINVKTKNGSRLLMMVLTVPVEAILKAAQQSFWIARDGVGLRMGDTDKNIERTTKLRKRK